MQITRKAAIDALQKCVNANPTSGPPEFRMSPDANLLADIVALFIVKPIEFIESGELTQKQWDLLNQYHPSLNDNTSH